MVVEGNVDEVDCVVDDFDDELVVLWVLKLGVVDFKVAEVKLAVLVLGVLEEDVVSCLVVDWVVEGVVVCLVVD